MGKSSITPLCIVRVTLATVFTLTIIISYYCYQFHKRIPADVGLEGYPDGDRDHYHSYGIGLRSYRMRKPRHSDTSTSAYDQDDVTFDARDVEIADRIQHYEDNADAMQLDSFRIEQYYHRKIITNNDISQQYFDQAIVLSFGFNHDEAIRSLLFATKIDPNCALCHWGIAYNLGSNINRHLKDETRLKLAIKHTQMAKSIVIKQEKFNTNHKNNNNLTGDQNSEKELFDINLERALVDAMISRFPENRTLQHDGSLYLEQFVEHLSKLIEKYPNDADLLAFYAESIMNTMPWNYYTRNFSKNIDSKENSACGYEYKLVPKQRTLLVYHILDRCLQLKPNHLLALHLFIHIYEEAVTAGAAGLSKETLNRVVRLTDRLRDLMSVVSNDKNIGIGHFIHMPSHIYIRIGRYQDAITANLNAINAAETYFKKYNIDEYGYASFYRNVYYCHRQAFVVFSSMMNGRYTTALMMQNKLFDTCSHALTTHAPLFEVATWMTKIYIQFGQFDKILAMSTSIKLDDNNDDQDEDDAIDGGSIISVGRKYYAAQFLFAKAFAMMSLKQCKDGYEVYQNNFEPLTSINAINVDNSAREDETVKKTSNRNSWIKHKLFGDTTIDRIINIAHHSLLARYYDVCKNDFDQSFNEWEITSLLVLNLSYIEPPFWPLNPRTCQAQLLYKFGKYKKAEQMFRDNLFQFGANGWDLKGLELTLKAQNKDYQTISQRFENAWQFSDVSIGQSCF